MQKTRPAMPTEVPISTALDAFERVVGPDALLGPGDPALDRYADPYSFSDHEDRPLAVARPASVSEVVGVVRAAREHALSLWPVSRGRNYAYGGAAARVPGSVICDLGRLDRVLEVDEECGVALVEPGVSFEALDAHLTESRLMISVPDLAWGSLVGNTLERGFGYTAHGEHAAVQCGLEVVLADGEVVRTGMGAMDGCRSWALYRGAFGPSLEGLFSQSNLGIVTKMGVWLQPRPERIAACELAVDERDGLGDLIDALRPLALDGTLQGTAMIGNGLGAASVMTGSRSRWFDGQGPIPDVQVGAMLRELGVGWWNARFGLYGSAELVAARRAAVERAARRVPGARLTVREYAGDVAPGEAAPADRALLGIPDNEDIRMAAWRGGEPAHADLGFVCPPTGRDASRLSALLRDELESAGFDDVGAFAVFRRHAIGLCVVAFDRSDEQERERVRELLPRLIASAAAAGYPPYRSHLDHMDLAAAQYGFGGHAALRLMERLKDALDPDGILAPGKQGVWPARSRVPI
jgi:4-cresol dehydrogenase (hydroxylating) flavoprotein subunit